MPHFSLPADYQIPPSISSLTDQDRAALIDHAAAAGAIFAKNTCQAATVAAYEDRLESQRAAFELACQQFASCPPQVATELAKISARLEPVERIFNSQTSSTKGRLTEEFIAEYLTTGAHSNGIVRYTAKTGGMGDLWYTTAAGITILIEIKNKRYITTEDIQKFDRDVTTAYAAQEIAGAMFISLDAQRFPNLPSMPINYRMVAGCPTIYAYIDHAERIDQCIQTLQCCITHGQTVSAVQFQCATQQATDEQAEYCILKKILAALDNSRAAIVERMEQLSTRDRIPKKLNKRAVRNTHTSCIPER